jgi:hypothetical protein
MHQLSLVELQQPAQEVARRNAESVLNVSDEDDGLAGALGRECLSRSRPPPDLSLGPQQPTVD